MSLLNINLATAQRIKSCLGLGCSILSLKFCRILVRSEIFAIFMFLLCTERVAGAVKSHFETFWSRDFDKNWLKLQMSWS